MLPYWRMGGLGVLNLSELSETCKVGRHSWIGGIGACGCRIAGESLPLLVGLDYVGVITNKLQDLDDLLLELPKI